MDFQTTLKLLLQANAADDAIPDDEHPGSMAAGLIAAALPRLEREARQQPQRGDDTAGRRLTGEPGQDRGLGS